MTRSLSELSELVAQVSDIYVERNALTRDGNWYLLKLQEELGELTAEYLKTTGQARRKGAEEATVREAMADEAADVLGMLLLFARHNDIDLDAALERKWFRYLSDSQV